ALDDRTRRSRYGVRRRTSELRRRCGRRALDPRRERPGRAIASGQAGFTMRVRGGLQGRASAGNEALKLTPPEGLGDPEGVPNVLRPLARVVARELADDVQRITQPEPALLHPSR